MSTRPPRTTMVEAMRRFAADPEHFVGMISDGQSSGIPPVVQSFLAGLATLEGVPFNYLVPDARMLPPESLRFFYIDPNWISALLDGACSIGRTTTLDQTADGAVASYLQQVVTEGSGNGGPFQTGILLRSQILADFPGLEIRAYQDGVTLPIARMETFSDSVLLAIWNGVADRIDLQEPPEGLQFGAMLKAGVFQIDLRRLDITNGVSNIGALVGSQSDPASYRLTPNSSTPSPQAPDFRNATKRVINAQNLASNLGGALSQQNPTYLGGKTAFTSTELAIQMVEEPATVSLILPWNTTRTSPAPATTDASEAATTTAGAARKPSAAERAAAARAKLDQFLKGI